MTFLSLAGSTDLDLTIMVDGLPFAVGSGCDLGSIEVNGQHNAAFMLSF